ncbi:hypothetical protein AB0L05_34135 [Nonomuraea pusilla]|uniref:hypothetical protein n=1 Tax=Nonomuraea pusilla TaxID=46177 RepID=UPI00333277F9
MEQQSSGRSGRRRRAPGRHAARARSGRRAGRGLWLAGASAGAVALAGGVLAFTANGTLGGTFTGPLPRALAASGVSPAPADAPYGASGQSGAGRGRTSPATGEPGPSASPGKDVAAGGSRDGGQGDGGRGDGGSGDGAARDGGSRDGGSRDGGQGGRPAKGRATPGAGSEGGEQDAPPQVLEGKADTGLSPGVGATGGPSATVAGSDDLDDSDFKADRFSRHTDQRAAEYFRAHWGPDDKAMKRLKDIRTIGGYLRIYTNLPESAGNSRHAITLCKRGLQYLKEIGTRTPVVFVQAEFGENGNPVLANILGPSDRSCRITYPAPR